MGKSDIKASGTIDNILAYFSPEKTMTGNITASSNYFNADEWMAGEESTTAGSGSATEAEYEVFDRFDFKLDATVKELDYDAYKLKNTLAKGQLSSSRMKIDEFETQLGDSRMKATGEITNVFPYLFEGGTLGGRINFQTNLLDLNQFMASETGSTTGSSNQAATLEPIQVPGNLDLVIASKIERLLYDNIEFQSVNGNLVVENKAVILDDMKARALGGDIMLSGAYDTKDPENPGFEIKYDLQKLDIMQAF